MKLSLQEYTLHFKHTFRVAGAKDRNCARIGILKLQTNGVLGYGEAAPSKFWGEDLDMVKEAAGKINLEKHETPLVYEIILKEVKEEIKPPQSLLAALDMALFDCIGKRMRITLHKFFGFSNQSTPKTSFTIGYADLDVIGQKVREAEAFPILKVKLGTSYDIEIIEKIRSITNKPIRVDANEGWEKEEAVEKICWLETQNVELIEQPLKSHRIEETLWIKERVSLPLFADESIKTGADIAKIAPAFDGINIKLMKCGGISEAITMVAQARAKNLKIMIGCMAESSLGIAAATTLLPLVDFADLDSHLLVTNDPFAGLQVNDGLITMSGLPGLGVVPKVEHFEKEY